MSSRWAVELASQIAKTNKTEGQIVLGEIQSLKPLAIKIGGMVIRKNIYINPALVLENESKIEELFLGLTDPLYLFLKQFHKSYVLKQGDLVVAYHSGNEFHILSKEVKLT